MTETSHTGRPRTITSQDKIAILCPYGHVVDCINTSEFAHSIWEARLGDPAYTVTCRGTIQTPDNTQGQSGGVDPETARSCSLNTVAEAK